MDSKILNLKRKVKDTNVLTVSYVYGGEYFRDMLLTAFRSIFADLTCNIVTASSLETSDIIVSSILNNERHSLGRYSAFLICISGEPWPMTSNMIFDLIIDTKTDQHMFPKWCPFVYYPFYLNSLYERRRNTKWDLIKRPSFPKSKFCAFMYFMCRKHREGIFDAISKYKSVDPLGQCRAKVNDDGNCCPVDTDRYVYNDDQTYNDIAVEKYKPYKFVLAVENYDYQGYVTEKILNAMFAGAIPIYWGTQAVKQHFNPASFIHMGDFPTTEDCVEYIRKVDTTPELYEQYTKQPFLINSEFNPYLRTDSKFMRDMRHHFMVDS